MNDWVFYVCSAVRRRLFLASGVDMPSWVRDELWAIYQDDLCNDWVSPS